MKIPSIDQLAEAGVHFGHREGKWHPTMKNYIHSSKKGVHIIDLEKTREKLKEALERVKDAGKKNEKVLLVGTKVRVGDLVAKIGQDYGLYYINYKWLGGMLTNFETIKRNIDRLEKMEEDLEEGNLEHYTKREQNEMRFEIEEKSKIYDGIRKMNDLPDLVITMDARIDSLAIREAKRLGIPVVAITDTNVDITNIDYPIPGNDDAIKAVGMILSLVGKAYDLGKKSKQSTTKKAKKKTKEGEKDE
jgi:small subunit ribosomal protein S2